MYDKLLFIFLCFVYGLCQFGQNQNLDWYEPAINSRGFIQGPATFEEKGTPKTAEKGVNAPPQSQRTTDGDDKGSAAAGFAQNIKIPKENLKIENQDALVFIEAEENSSDAISNEVLSEEDKTATTKVPEKIIDVESCQTVDDETGDCIVLTECKSYMKLVSQAGRDPAARLTLQRSQCGFEQDVTKVCCPRPETSVITTTENVTTSASIEAEGREKDKEVIEDVNNDPDAKTPSKPTNGTTVEVNAVTKDEQRNKTMDGDACQTVDNEVGNCIPLRSCEPYMKLVSLAASDAKSRLTLLRSRCGSDQSHPKVCCPSSGITVVTPVLLTTSRTPTKNQGTNSRFEPPPLEIVSFPEPPICGSSNASDGRIVGGDKAKLGDFPWLALLGYKSEYDTNTTWRCGGTLVTALHVLTAAHCIHHYEDQLYVVRLGELDLASTEDGASPIDVPIKTNIKHEQYNSATFVNDIGILVLEKTVQFTELIKPICLPFEESLRSQKFERYNPLVAGWGEIQFRGPTASHLQVVQLPVQTQETCIKAFIKYKKQVIDDRVLCAGFPKGGKDSCKGDSGGPLMLPNWNNVTFKSYFYQIGVVSFGKNCAEAGFPGVYSRVTHFIPWIEKIVLRG